MSAAFQRFLADYDVGERPASVQLADVKRAHFAEGSTGEAWMTAGMWRLRGRIRRRAGRRLWSWRMRATAPLVEQPEAVGAAVAEFLGA